VVNPGRETVEEACRGIPCVPGDSLAVPILAMRSNGVEKLQGRLWDGERLACVEVARQEAMPLGSHQQSEVCAQRRVTARHWRLPGSVGCEEEDWHRAATWL